MNRSQPTPTEALQLHRLRELRVKRAREQLAQARAAREQAAAAVAGRERKIGEGKAAIDELAMSVVSKLVPHLPRWISTVAAQRAKLIDRWERDVFALTDERQALEAADVAL